MYFKCISIEYLLNCAHRNEYLQAYTKLHTHKNNIYIYIHIYRSYYIVHNCIAYTHESMYANLYIHKYISAFYNHKELLVKIINVILIDF